MVSLFFHIAEVMPFIWLFLLGKLALEGRQRITHARSHATAPSRHICRFFPVSVNFSFALDECLRQQDL